MPVFVTVQPSAPNPETFDSFSEVILRSLFGSDFLLGQFALAAGNESEVEIFLTVEAPETNVVISPREFAFNLAEFAASATPAPSGAVASTAVGHIPVFTGRDGTPMIFLHYESDYSARAFTLHYEESSVVSLRVTGTYRDGYHAGSSGDDVILAFGGNDSVYGGAGADHINGGLGKDLLRGGNGSDLIIGNGGNDHLSGGAHADRLYGGRGRDVLDGGYGHDVLSGGAGPDEFVFRLGEGTDRITDFEIGIDSLRFQFDGYVNMHQGLTEDGLTIIFEGITVFLEGVDSFVAMDHFIMT